MLAAGQHRPDVAAARRIWIPRRQPFMGNALERLVFIDETPLNTKLVKTSGWAPVGERLADHAAFGHWPTQTFIAGVTPGGTDGPQGDQRRHQSEAFRCLCRNPHRPDPKTGRCGDPGQSLKPQKQSIGAWLLFLPPYSPALNPIEMAFSKRKALIRDNRNGNEIRPCL